MRQWLFSYESYKAGIGFRSLKWRLGAELRTSTTLLQDLFHANSHVSENADFNGQQHYRQANAVFGTCTTELSRRERRCWSGLQSRAAHRGCAFGDLTTTKDDVVVSAIGNQAAYALQPATGGNHWILIKNRGVKSNRDGIGTRSEDNRIRPGAVQPLTTRWEVTRVRTIRRSLGVGADTVIKEIELKGRGMVQLRTM